MIDANTVASEICKCTSPHGTFCQQYCLYRLCSEDKDVYVYAMKMALRRGFIIGEFIPTKGMLSPEWTFAVNGFIDKLIEILQISTFTKSDVINRIKFQTWQN